jgi:hypothetical protein
MSALVSLQHLEQCRAGIVGFALRSTLNRLLAAPELASARLKERLFVEKILPPHTGNARNWATQQMLKDPAIYLLHRGRCLDEAWFECAVVLAVVGHLVLLDVDVDGSEAAAASRLLMLCENADPQVRQYAQSGLLQLIGRDGLPADTPLSDFQAPT